MAEHTNRNTFDPRVASSPPTSDSAHVCTDLSIDASAWLSGLTAPSSCPTVPTNPTAWLSLPATASPGWSLSSFRLLALFVLTFFTGRRRDEGCMNSAHRRSADDVELGIDISSSGQFVKDESQNASLVGAPGSSAGEDDGALGTFPLDGWAQ